MNLENSPGSHRVVPEADMEEVRAIYQQTGAVSLMDAVEKGMEQKLGSKAEVDKYWETWLETGDSRNYEIKEYEIKGE